nr:adrenodoxin-like protein 2, mitochondrial isoform X1 [Ipomoea batatas]
MLLLHLHPCISLQKHPIFSPPSLFFNSHNKASVSAFGVGRWEALKKSRRRGQGPPLRAAEKDSDYEVDPDKALEALRKLDEQLQSLAQKKPDPPPPKIRASDVNGTPSRMTQVPEAKEITSSDLVNLAFVLTILYNVFFLAVIKPAVDGPEDIAPEITSVLETQQDSSPFQGTANEHFCTAAGNNDPGNASQKEKISVTFVDKDGEEQQIKVPLGMSMLEAAHENDIELEGACEGSLARSTCHVIVMDMEYYNKLEDPEDEENDMSDLAFGLTETSRLGCQIIAKPELNGIRLAIPAATRNFAVDGFKPKPH